MGSGNWIVDNLNSALEMWNGRLAEIWQLISTSPESFKGGGVWNVIVNINDGLKAVGYPPLTTGTTACSTFRKSRPAREWRIRMCTLMS